MMYRSLAGSIVAAATAALLIGCAQVPQTELANAKSAIAAAKNAEADKYAVTEFSAAMDSLNAGITEINQQKAKSALGRSYDKAKSSLTAAVSIADKAKVDAAAGKENVKAEAQSLVEKATTSVAEVKGLIEKAPKGKDTKAAFDSMQNDVKALEASIEEAKQLLSNDSYSDARDKANAAITGVDTIKTKLAEATVKKAEKPGKKKSK
ncbi:MAG TPA: hypothetical protein DCO75_07750 [Fibrobacteres bacterium]|jgi:hypothetical protein|nr:hypothetical protein [Fibrobacterota bacterium]